MIHIHNSHFKIHNHALLISNPLPFGHLLFDISFSIVYYDKQGLDASDDGFFYGIYLLKLNQGAVHLSVPKKCRLL